MDPSEMSWVAGEQIAGTNNWINTGATNIPMKWTGTITGTNPTLVNVMGNDLRPAMGSPLIDKGATSTSGPAGHAFPSPLAAPLFHPPARALMAPGTAAPRPNVATIDIGAYEFGSGPPADGGLTDSGMTMSDAIVDDTSTSSDAIATDDAFIPDVSVPENSDTPTSDDGGCGCRTSARAPAPWVLMLALGLLVRRRRHM
jgi:MYXO-CTERM domain-containing protein